jgi:hypothetical protein
MADAPGASGAFWRRELYANSRTPVAHSCARGINFCPLEDNNTERGAAQQASERKMSDERKRPDVEVVKALAALQPLYGKDNIEIVTGDGTRVRGVVKSMKTTQALTKPSVKIQRPDGEVIKITFDTITEIVDHNPAESER